LTYYKSNTNFKKGKKMSATTINETIRGRNLPDFIRAKIDSPDRFFKINLVIEPIEEKEVENRWAKIAEQISEQAPLTDLGENLIKANQEFRANFELKSPI
jgi:hypothetical protein